MYQGFGNGNGCPPNAYPAGDVGSQQDCIPEDDTMGMFGAGLLGGRTDARKFIAARAVAATCGNIGQVQTDITPSPIGFAPTDPTYPGNFPCPTPVPGGCYGPPAVVQIPGPTPGGVPGYGPPVVAQHPRMPRVPGRGPGATAGRRPTPGYGPPVVTGIVPGGGYGPPVVAKTGGLPLKPVTPVRYPVSNVRGVQPRGFHPVAVTRAPLPIDVGSQVNGFGSPRRGGRHAGYKGTDVCGGGLFDAPGIPTDMASPVPTAPPEGLDVTRLPQGCPPPPMAPCPMPYMPAPSVPAPWQGGPCSPDAPCPPQPGMAFPSVPGPTGCGGFGVDLWRHPNYVWPQSYAWRRR